MPEQVTMSYVSRCVSEEYYKKRCNIAQEQCNDWKKVQERATKFQNGCGIRKSIIVSDW